MSEVNEPISRRNFIKTIMAAAGTCYVGALAYPVYRYLASPAEKAVALSMVSEVTLPEADQLPLGSAMMFKFGARPALLIHHKDDTWVALDAVCTHLGCTVEYQSDRDVIHCNCHSGEYDSKTGKNISGPPPKPLTAYVAKVIEGGLLITRG